MTRREEIEYSQRTKEFFMKRDLNKPLCINTAIEWADKTMIEKACQWMEENLREVHPRTGEEVCIVNLNRFREAMEE